MLARRGRSRRMGATVAPQRQPQRPARDAVITPTTTSLGISLAALTGARLALGEPSWTDAATVGSVILAYPFVEWIAHRYVLHSPEFTFAGRTRSLGVARNHAAHHANPTDSSKVASETGRNLALAIGGATLPFVVTFRAVRPSLTAASMVIAGLLTYEATHGLIHSGHRGNSDWFRRVRRNHLRHHYRNETQWFGVASTAADGLLGTRPDPAAVEFSATARRLRVAGPDTDLPAAATAPTKAAAGEPSATKP